MGFSIKYFWIECLGFKGLRTPGAPQLLMQKKLNEMVHFCLPSPVPDSLSDRCKNTALHCRYRRPPGLGRWVARQQKSSPRSTNRTSWPSTFSKEPVQPDLASSGASSSPEGEPSSSKFPPWQSASSCSGLIGSNQAGLQRGEYCQAFQCV